MRSLFSGLILSLLLANVVSAQQSVTGPKKPVTGTSSTPTVTPPVVAPAPPPAPAPVRTQEVSPGGITPEMRAYMQEMRRQNDPMNQVRRVAEAKAQQRRARMAAMDWYGLSNSRPTANPVPFYGSYSPMWMGNSWDGYHWLGGAPPSVLLYQETSVYQR